MKAQNKSNIDTSLYKKDLTVMVYDLDIRRSSGMPMICNWLQEVGIGHGLAMARHSGFDVSDIVFVLTRLNVKMDRYPSWMETVTVESWLSPVTDRYARRNFLLHGADGKIIGRAINSAVPFSLSARSGGTFTGDLNAHAIDRESALPHDFTKIPVIEECNTERKLQVRYFDCDLFYHVNNVKYIQWCIESLPDDYLRKHALHEIDVNFRAEGNLGDSLSVKKITAEDADSFVHAVTDSSGMKDLVRMKSLWK
ncbi:MAG TPA: thioesterase [Spirochaetota bacterium]|nr:thioesterase [Spirochaetota bacterium]